MDDIQIWVKALGKSLGKFLLVGHCEAGVFVDDVNNLDQAVAEVGPLTSLIKKRIDLSQLVFKSEVLYRYQTRVYLWIGFYQPSF